VGGGKFLKVGKEKVKPHNPSGKEKICCFVPILVGGLSAALAGGRGREGTKKKSEGLTIGGKTGAPGGFRERGQLSVAVVCLESKAEEKETLGKGEGHVHKENRQEKLKKKKKWWDNSGEETNIEILIKECGTTNGGTCQAPIVKGKKGLVGGTGETLTVKLRIWTGLILSSYYCTKYEKTIKNWEPLRMF